MLWDGVYSKVPYAFIYSLGEHCCVSGLVELGPENVSYYRGVLIPEGVMYRFQWTYGLGT